MHKQTIKDINWQGQKTLVRVDFNVPMNDQGEITDDARIQAALPTITYLLQQGAAVILMSHLGRPKGGPDPRFSLEPVARHLGTLVTAPVHFVGQLVGPEATQAAQTLQPGHILVLENTRFHSGETKNDPELALALAKLGSCFVNDAFGSAHRAHASTTGVADHLPAVAGFLMEKELAYLGGALEEPKRPFVAILGGAKISDKIGVIQALLTKVDAILIGGGMANTFLAAQGHNMARSLVEADAVETASQLLAQAEAFLHLPVDLRVAADFSADAEQKVVSVDEVPADWMALDIGPATVAHFANRLAGAGTVIWNGPMGVFEMPPFDQGTTAVAQILAELNNAVTIIGGGDSAAAVRQSGRADQISHISTGGGASLEFLEGKDLPGVTALDDQK